MSSLPIVNYEDYLSHNEKKMLHKINNTSNKMEQKIKKETDFFNLSINDIINNWSKHHLEIVNELIELFKTMEDYDSEHVFGFVTHFIRNFFDIVNKTNDRLIYTGITLILLSISLYFISTTK